MKEIILPRNTLIILCGPAGCGKSTFAARHFLRTQTVSSDECRALVFDDPANQAISGHAFHLMHFIIEKRLRLRRLTVADATNLKREDRKPLQKIARQYEFNTAVVLFDLPLETCLARNQARDRKVPEEALVAQYALFEQTMRSIKGEGFDYIYALDERAASEARIRVTRYFNRRPA